MDAVVALGGLAAVVADGDRQEVEHQVGPADLVVAADEPAGLEVVGGADTPTPEEPLRTDPGLVTVGQPRRDRHRLGGGVLDVDLEVVLQVGTHAGQLDPGLDADGAQLLGVADAGQLQQLGAVERAAAQDHLSRRHRPAQPAPAGVVDARTTVALHPQAGDEGEGLDVEVGPVHDRVEVGPGGRQPAAAVHVAVDLGEALLAVAVDVVGQRVAGLLHPASKKAPNNGDVAGPRSSTSGPDPPRQASAPALPFSRRQVSIRLK